MQRVRRRGPMVYSWADPFHSMEGTNEWGIFTIGVIVKIYIKILHRLKGQCHENSF